MMEPSLGVFTALGHQEVEVGVEIGLLSKGLDGGHDPRELSAGCGLEVFEEGTDGRLAKIFQKPALVAEEDAEHPGDDKDDLAVRDTKKECLPHPLGPFLSPPRMAQWAKSAATR